MADRDFIVFDFETGGRDPHTCQPTQLAAIALHGRTLEMKKVGGEFNSEIWAETDDDKAIAAGLAPLEEEALKVTGKTREQIAKAPKPKAVWTKFLAFVNKHNWKGTTWFAPIPAGYNIINYDMPIINRMAKLYGGWDDKKGQNKFFNPIKKYDMMDDMFLWTESDPTIKSISMDNVRKRMGMESENAHDALQDVKDTANIIIKFLKTRRAMYKTLSPKIDKAFANGGLYIE